MIHRCLAQALAGCTAACLLSVTASAATLRDTPSLYPASAPTIGFGDGAWYRGSLDEPALWASSWDIGAARDSSAWSLTDPPGSTGGAWPPPAVFVPRAMFGALSDGVDRFGGIDDAQMSPVPLPGSLGLLASGILAAGAWMLRRRQRETA
ncbi:MAG TPA: hypothetical protein VMD56_05905 [Steroidobacteraceae bacterium]|nr:hypothetical protein [Steroidobacteraceae bacterium]